MSYDIHLEADLGNGMIRVGSLDWYYTSNCSQMWEDAGVDLKEFNGVCASSLIPKLSKALLVLTANPEKYKAMNPTNGWGSYSSLLIKLQELREGLLEAPDAIMRVYY